MPLLSCFSLVGDSNIHHHMTSANTRGRLPMSEAQVITGGGRLSSLSATLESVRPESDACVVACISNILSSASVDHSSSLVSKIEPLIKSFFEKVASFGLSRPALNVFVCPPMYRTNPIWYRDGMSTILQQYAQTFNQLVKIQSTNVRMMPCFSKMQLESDGVHLNPVSGVEYVLYLFEAPEAIMTSGLMSTEEKVDAVEASTRTLEDRVHVLEQDHARLSQSTEHQTAVNEEHSR